MNNTLGAIWGAFSAALSSESEIRKPKTVAPISCDTPQGCLPLIEEMVLDGDLSQGGPAGCPIFTAASDMETHDDDGGGVGNDSSSACRKGPPRWRGNRYFNDPTGLYDTGNSKMLPTSCPGSFTRRDLETICSISHPQARMVSNSSQFQLATRL